MPPFRNKPTSSALPDGITDYSPRGSPKNRETKYLESTPEVLIEFNASTRQERSKELQIFEELYIEVFSRKPDWTPAGVMDRKCVLELHKTNEQIQSMGSRWLESVCTKVGKHNEAHEYIKAIYVALVMLENEHLRKWNDKLVDAASRHLGILEEEVKEENAHLSEGKAEPRLNHELFILSCILLRIGWESNSDSEKQRAEEVLERFDALLGEILKRKISPLLTYKSNFIANVSNFVSKGPQGYRKLYLPKTVMKEPAFPFVNSVALQRSSRWLMNNLQIELKHKYTSRKFYGVNSPIEWIKDLDALEFDVRLAESRCQTSMSETFVEDLFCNGDVLQSMNNVMVFGDPGSGKTSLARKLAYQWADGKWGTGFSMVYYVHLNSFQYSQVNIGGCEIREVLAEAIALWCYPPVVTADDFSHLRQKDGSGGQDYLIELRERISEQLDRKDTLIIADSDDWSCLDDRDIASNIVRSNLGHKLMLFCRSRDLTDLRTRFDAQIECKGVTNDYIQRATEGSPKIDSLGNLIHRLKEEKDVWALVHKPLHLASLVGYWNDIATSIKENQDSFCDNPKSKWNESAMYREMVAGQLSSYLAQHPELNEEREPILEALEKVAIRSVLGGALNLSKETLGALIESEDQMAIVIGAGLIVKTGSGYFLPKPGFQDYFVGGAMARALSPSLNSPGAGNVHDRYQRILDAANRNSLDGFPSDDWMVSLARLFYKTMDSHSYSQLYFQWLDALRYKYLAGGGLRKKLRCEISEQLTILAVSGTTKGVRDKALKTLCDIGWECRATGGWGADAAVLEAVLNDLYYLHRRATIDNRASTRAAITELLQNESKETAGLKERFLNGASSEEKLSEQKRAPETSRSSDSSRTTVSDYEIKESQRRKGSIGLTESLTDYYLSLRPTFPCDFILRRLTAGGNESRADMFFGNESESGSKTVVFSCDKNFDRIGFGDRISQMWATGKWIQDFETVFWLRDNKLASNDNTEKTLTKALAASLFKLSNAEGLDRLESTIEAELGKSSTLVILDALEPDLSIMNDLITADRSYTLYLLGSNEVDNIDRAVVHQVIAEPAEEQPRHTHKEERRHSPLSQVSTGIAVSHGNSSTDESMAESTKVVQIFCKFQNSSKRKIFDIGGFHVDSDQIVGRFFYDTICEQDSRYKQSDFAVYRVPATSTDVKQVFLSKTFLENEFDDQDFLVVRSGQDYIYATETTVKREWEAFERETEIKNKNRSWFRRILPNFLFGSSNQSPEPAEDGILRLASSTDQSGFLAAEDTDKSNFWIAISVDEIIDQNKDRNLQLLQCRKAQRKLNEKLQSTSVYLFDWQLTYRLKIQLRHKSTNTPKIDINAVRISFGTSEAIEMDLEFSEDETRKDVTAFAVIDGSIISDIGLRVKNAGETELRFEIDLETADGLIEKTIDGSIKAVITGPDMHRLVGQSLQSDIGTLNSLQGESRSVDEYCILLFVNSEPGGKKTV